MKEDNPIIDIADATIKDVKASAAGEPTVGEKTTKSDERKADASEQRVETDEQAVETAEQRTEENSEGAPSLRTIIRQQTVNDDLPLSKNITLRKVLGGDILNTQFLRRQIWVIVIATLFIIVYISNRYKCQQNLIKIDKLTNELEDAKYRALSSSSDLTQQTRESKVLERLHNDKDSTLHIAMQPPYIINVPNNE